MLKKILDNVFFLVKKFIYSILVIYAFNMIIYPVGIIIPMNLFTIITIMLCGFPAIIGFSLFCLFII